MSEAPPHVWRRLWSIIVWLLIVVFALYVLLFVFAYAFYSRVELAEDCIVAADTIDEARDCWGITGDRQATLDDVPPGYAGFLIEPLETEGSTVWEIDFLFLGVGAFHVVVGPDGHILGYVPSYE